MIGRGAIRNPWIFEQIRQRSGGTKMFLPSGREVLAYIRDLYETLVETPFIESAHVNKLKKYMNFLGDGIEPAGAFLHAMRRATSGAEFFRICEEHLDHESPMPLEPFKPALAQQAAALSPAPLL
jgi:tRNA-dihydrouridine synthase B